MTARCLFIIALWSWTNTGSGTSETRLVYATEQARVRASKPNQLFDRILAFAGSLQDEDRAFVMAELSKRTVKSNPELSQKAALASFLASKGMLTGPYRQIVQQRAVEILGENDPPKAIRNIRLMDLPEEDKTGLLPYEDRRSITAYAVFANYYQNYGHRKVRVVIDTSKFLGTTGAYPYAAMILVLKGELQKGSIAEAKEILLDAQTYYSRDQKFASTTPEYIALVRAMDGTVDAGVMREMLGVIVTVLSERREQQSANGLRVITREGATVTRSLSVQESQREEIYNLLLKYDPEKAEDFKKLYPDLKPSETGAQGFLVGSGDDSRSSFQYQSELRTLREVQKMAQKDSAAALKKARQLTDPSLRIEAFTAVSAAKAMNQNGAEEAAGLLADSEKLVDDIKDDTEKLAGYVSLCSAAKAAKNKEVLEKYVDRGLGLAERILREEVSSSRSTPLPFQKGFREAIDMAEIAASLSYGFTAERVEQVKEPVLQSYLLMAIASGMEPEDRR